MVKVLDALGSTNAPHVHPRSSLTAPLSVSPRGPCQASSDSFSLPDGSDLREAADKQSFHCLVKDDPIPCHSSSIFSQEQESAVPNVALSILERCLRSGAPGLAEK